MLSLDETHLHLLHQARYDRLLGHAVRPTPRQIGVGLAGRQGNPSEGSFRHTRILGIGSQMIVHALGLKEDGIARMPPEMCHRIAAVTATGLYLQATAAAALVGARLALLLAPRLIAYGRAQIDLGAVGQRAMLRADKYTQAALLQDVHIVIVGVAHCPAGDVLLGLLVVHRIDQTHMPIAPLTELVELQVGHLRHDRIIDVPISLAFAAAVVVAVRRHPAGSCLQVALLTLMVVLLVLM